MDTEQAQHTPGPWELREVGHGPGRIFRVEVIAPQYLYGKRTHSRFIAQIVDYRDWTDQPANARLIAAAPELLAALVQIIQDLPRKRDWLDPEVEAQARAAIAKAKGK